MRGHLNNNVLSIDILSIDQRAPTIRAQPPVGFCGFSADGTGGRWESSGQRRGSVPVQRQAEGKGGACPWRTLCPDLPPVHLDDALGDSQPQPRPAGGASARAVSPVKSLEDVRQILGGDATTCIPHEDHYPVFFEFTTGRDSSPGRCVA